VFGSGTVSSLSALIPARKKTDTGLEGDVRNPAARSPFGDAIIAHLSASSENLVRKEWYTRLDPGPWMDGNIDLSVDKFREAQTEICAEVAHCQQADGRFGEP